MSLRVAVICAHADDETLGCGGTMLKHVAAGDAVHWILASSPLSPTFSAEFSQRRSRDIVTVAAAYGLASVTQLGFAAAGLDAHPLGEVIQAMTPAVAAIAPDIVYVVYRGDVHSDHRVVFDVVWAAVKPLRGHFPRRVLAFESLSSTNLAPPLAATAFIPQAYSDISPYLDRKLAILRLYETEVMSAPAPRSIEAVAALAALRGSTIHVTAAEAFMVLRDLF